MYSFLLLPFQMYIFILRYTLYTTDVHDYIYYRIIHTVLTYTVFFYYYLNF